MFYSHVAYLASPFLNVYTGPLVDAIMNTDSGVFVSEMAHIYVEMYFKPGAAIFPTMWCSNKHIDLKLHFALAIIVIIIIMCNNKYE